MSSDRVPTGIKGMDLLIGGGFPQYGLNLISGPAGSGKSLFALQYVWNGVHTYGKTAAYVALEESRSGIERAAGGFGMDLTTSGNGAQLHLIDLGEIRGGEGRSVVGFHELQDFLRTFLAASHASLLAIDSLPVVGLYYRSPQRLREELFSFARFLREQRVTPLLITESTDDASLTRFGVEQFVADSFIVLGLEKVKGELRRTITVRKMRFTKHDTGTHPFFITPRGIEISPEERVMA